MYASENDSMFERKIKGLEEGWETGGRCQENCPLGVQQQEQKTSAHVMVTTAFISAMTFLPCSSSSPKYQKKKLLPISLQHVSALWLYSERELGTASPCGSEGSTVLIAAHSREFHKREVKGTVVRGGFFRETMNVHDMLRVYVVPHTELKD